MALSKLQRRYLEIAVGSKPIAEAIADAIDSGSNPQAAAVAALAASTDFTALVPTASTLADVTGTYAIPAEPTGAEVDTSINALGDLVDSALDGKADNSDVETLRGEVEGRMDSVESKINAIISALKAAGLMAS